MRWHQLGTSCLLLVVATSPLMTVSQDVAGALDNVLDRDYDRNQPPKKGAADPVKVQFHVTVVDVDSVDEASMTFNTDVFLALKWKDPRLVYPRGSDEDGHVVLPIQWLDRLWKPDVFFQNAKDVRLQETPVPNHYIWLYGDTTVLYMSKVSLKLSCQMSFENYPRDRQDCPLKMESLYSSTEDVAFEWDEQVPLKLESDILVSKMDLVSADMGNCTKTYTTGTFPCLKVDLGFQRRAGSFLARVYLPVCLTVALAWLAFCVKAEALVARLALGVSSLFLLIVQHVNASNAIPTVSYLTAADVFMWCCIGLVFLAIVEIVVDHLIIGNEVKDVEPATAINGKMELVRLRLMQQRRRKAARCADWTCGAILFPVAFAVVNLCFWYSVGLPGAN